MTPVQLANTPPQPHTADFDIAGQEVPFPQQEMSPEIVLERISTRATCCPSGSWNKASSSSAVARVVLTKAVTIDDQTFPQGTGWTQRTWTPIS
jgi:hypothetical protein